MQKISPIRFGGALGISGSVFYVACMIFMAITPMETVVWISNALLHGIDVQSIMRENVPLQQALFGILSTFVGGFIFGVLTGCIYNLGLGRNAGT